MPSSVKRVEIASIIIGEGRRPVRDLDALEDSVRTVGLLNPITLTEAHRLIAGLHRIRVYERMGEKCIPAIILTLDEVDAQLAEIDENLIRNELTALERCEQLARRKELYLAKHPQTKHGGDRRSQEAQSSGNDFPLVPAFADDVAGKASVTPRSVRQEVQIANSLAQDVKETLRGTAIEDKKTELLRLARLPAEQQRQVAKEIKDGKAKGVKAALNVVAASAIAAEPPPLPTGPFRVIVVDPPWAYDNRPTDETHRAANPYPPMSLEAIKAYPVPPLAHEDCILWLWTTNAHMLAAFEVLDAWGFEHKTILTWVKGHFGTGDWLRGQTEHCLLASRGRPTRTLSNQSTVISGPLREHSRKPDSFYKLVESLCPGSKVELFARTQRDGWTAHGNQTGLFPGSARVQEGQDGGATGGG